MTTKMKWILLAITCLLGFTSMSFELIILRQLINFVGSNTIITSIVMSFILYKFFCFTIIIAGEPSFLLDCCHLCFCTYIAF